MSAIFGETLTFPQENGPEVELVVFGDEFYSRRETKDGYTVIYDDKLGQYGYAILCEGEFASSGIPILEAPPPELQPHLEEAEPIRREKFARRYTQLRPSHTDLPSQS
ncbi:MAG: hypothetical protein GPI90_07720 [Microcystis aeruginosa K13-05]|jgi:hypothetical protein|uniref:Uncharacterized protein n=1 Tax=Microcystis aeruginosa PCC 9717 TaxID=1160286 RepID=I4FXV5_MICAE|nr:MULTISPECIES: hypothetical protein [Microcystis]MCE2661470.1 hypothetical protein [Microcystis sp. 53602_E8]MCZ8365034.1 hypothetical protein [Microcystis sp. LE19-251.1A]MDJ0528101.1 hypothetical protein [Microcystis sp. M53600_WE12]NCR79863.1 hypothetical protein [Microcystis aeruginosa K13-10]NCR84545.1 hypothetical protein [Microcystis aeruginosa K13-05]